MKSWEGLGKVWKERQRNRKKGKEEKNWAYVFDSGKQKEETDQTNSLWEKGKHTAQVRNPQVNSAEARES